jgi:hypothetical protein
MGIAARAAMDAGRRSSFRGGSMNHFGRAAMRAVRVENAEATRGLRRRLTACSR